MENRILLLVLLASLFIGCSSDDDDLWAEDEPVYFVNHPLPHDASHLKVLAIGNSFSTDGTALIDVIAPSIGISKEKYCVYVMAFSCASLEDWYKAYTAGDLFTPQLMAGDITMPDIKAEMTLRQILANDWDVVVIQQYSYHAVNYKSFNPALRHLIDCIRQNCTNPDVALAWQSVWAYSSKNMDAYTNSKEQWEALCTATKTMVKRDGIDIVIPTGTAIQNARQIIITQGELTRDDLHLDYGLGRYIAACTWVERLFSPVFHTSIKDATATYVPMNTDDTRYPATVVTASYAGLAINCAYYAVQFPFKLTDIVTLITP